MAARNDATEQALRESEERLQLAVYATNIGIFEHDHRTDAVYWSPALREILGRCADEPASLQTYIEMIHPADREERVATIREAHDPTGEGLDEAEHRIIKCDGSVRWVRVCARTLFDGAAETRHPARTIWTVADITEQMQTEAALLEASEFTRQVVNSVQEGLAVLDSTLRYSLWNMFMERLSGKPASAVLGKRPWEVFHFLSEATSRPLLESVLSGTATDVPDLFTDPSAPGQVASVSQVLVPLRDASGRVVGVLCSLHDITARKHTEEARNRLAAIVESAEDAVISKTLNGTITSWNVGAESDLQAISYYSALTRPDCMTKPEPIVYLHGRQGSVVAWTGNDVMQRSATLKKSGTKSLPSINSPRMRNLYVPSK